MGIPLMRGKSQFWVLQIDSLRPQAANILKQELLSRGAETALPRGALDLSNKSCTVLVFATDKQLGELYPKLIMHQFGLPALAKEIKNTITNYRSIPEPLTVGASTFHFGRRTYVMGILNVTPDSFSDGGKYSTIESAVERALQMEQSGADIIDIGGESTRPGARPVGAKEELGRVLPVIKAIRKRSRVPLSIDTYKAAVAEAAVDSGVDLINDISALRADRKMARVAKKYNVPVALMHMQGTPRNMQLNPSYNDLWSEVLEYLRKSIEIAQSYGILPSKIIVDPGIGFGKKIENNLEIIDNLSQLKVLGRAILAGPSRKSFIGKILKDDTASRLEGTVAAAALLAARGADIIRVHDVEQMNRAIKVSDAIIRRKK